MWDLCKVRARRMTHARLLLDQGRRLPDAIHESNPDHPTVVHWYAQGCPMSSHPLLLHQPDEGWRERRAKLERKLRHEVTEERQKSSWPSKPQKPADAGAEEHAPLLDTAPHAAPSSSSSSSSRAGARPASPRRPAPEPRRHTSETKHAGHHPDRPSSAEERVPLLHEGPHAAPSDGSESSDDARPSTAHRFGPNPSRHAFETEHPHHPPDRPTSAGERRGPRPGCCGRVWDKFGPNIVSGAIGLVGAGAMGGLAAHFAKQAAASAKASADAAWTLAHPGNNSTKTQGSAAGGNATGGANGGPSGGKAGPPPARNGTAPAAGGH